MALGELTPNSRNRAVTPSACESRIPERISRPQVAPKRDVQIAVVGGTHLWMVEDEVESFGAIQQKLTAVENDGFADAVAERFLRRVMQFGRHGGS